MRGSCDALRINGILFVNHKQTWRWPADAAWKGIQIVDAAGNVRPAFETPFREHLTQVMAAIDRVGCEKPRIKFADELRWADKLSRNAITSVGNLIKDVDPRFEIVGSGSHLDADPNVASLCSRWDFAASHVQYYRKEYEAAERRRVNWIYANDVPQIDLPLSRTRLFHWGLWQGGFAGAFNWWSINNWKDPWNGEDPLFGRGIAIYPPRPELGESGPVSSLRWEIMRQGLEDYEYLHLLEGRIEAMQDVATSVTVARARQALERVNEVSGGWPVGESHHPYTLDAKLVQAVRTEIADAIESLLPCGTSDNCDGHAICMNTADSFICTCQPGYTGDGVTCRSSEDGGASDGGGPISDGDAGVRGATPGGCGGCQVSGSTGSGFIALLLLFRRRPRHARR